MNKRKKVVLGVTGSIAAYKSADIVSQLINQGLEVLVVMTKEAQAFITPLTLSVLSGNKTYTDMFETPQVWDVEHVSLADQADLILIAPATANVIAKLTMGLCDDVLTCIVAATKAPVVVAPAMNNNMYEHKITQANIAGLKKLGYKFVGPKLGRLACGKQAMGCLADVGDLVEAVKRYIA
ncbi:MAG: flavoprotein [Candidatus Omnitrophota bacterium]